jgi:hypothetical protein
LSIDFLYKVKTIAIFFLKTFFDNHIFCTFASSNSFIVLWCNGSTTDSGPVCLGSNPSKTTTLTAYLAYYQLFAPLLFLKK